MSQPTVVTAYYAIPSKFSVDKYIQWIYHFWPKTQCPLIFFTDPRVVSQFETIFKDRPGPTKVIGISFDKLSAFQKLSPKVWLHTKQYDEEHQHSPELYAIWYEKKEFVLRAISLNPFGSDQFVWCDAGICRYPHWIPYLSQFPKREMIPPNGKMLVLRIAPFDGTVDTHGIYGEFKKEVTVGGGILAADISGWKRWSKIYDTTLMKYYLADRFIGKDQNIMASMILQYPDSVIMIDPPEKMNTIERWFYLLLFLAGLRVD
jgi:hypothetical protein